MKRQPFSGLPKLTDARPRTASPFTPNAPPQSHTPVPPAPPGGIVGNGLPNQPFQPNQQNASTVTGNGITSTVAQQSPYVAPEEWYADEWIKFSVPEQRSMTSWLPHYRTLFFAARRYGDRMVKVRDETTGEETEMTGWAASTKVGQMADKANHQAYLDRMAERRGMFAQQQAQPVPFRLSPV